MLAALVNPILPKRRGHIFRRVFRLLHPIPHGNGMGSIFQHVKVIRAVPKGIGVLMGNPQDFTDLPNPCSFVVTLWDNLHKIPAPVDNRVIFPYLLFQFFLPFLPF